MSKIKLKAFLENKTEQNQHVIEAFGIKNQKKIVYQDNDILMILHIVDNQIYMKRIQNEDILSCQFISSAITEGSYDIKSVNMAFQVKIYTRRLNIEDNLLEIEYQMTLEENLPQEYYYQLAYEVIP